MLSAQDIRDLTRGLSDDQLATVRAAMDEWRSAPTDTSPLRLQSIRPTDDVLSNLDRLHVEYLMLTEHGDRRAIERLRTAIRDAERALELARIRDRIAATRPDACWCLGYGGRRPSYLPIPTGYDETVRAAIITETEVLAEYCGCPEGTARKAADDATRESYRAGYRQRRIARIVGNSGLPGGVYAGLSWRDHPDRRAARLCAEWLEKPGDTPWLLLYGLPGRGKTALAVGLGYELARRSVGVLFRPVPDLLQEFRSAYAPDQEISEAARIEAYKSVDVLILDDIAAEKMTDAAGDRLYQIVNHRHNEMLRTIITSNLDPEALADHLGSRMLGRIKRLARFVPMSGSDLRDRR